MTSSEFSFFSKSNVNLDIAGIYFVSGWQHIQAGSKCFNKLEKKKKQYNKLHSKLKKESDFEENVIPLLRELEVFYEPVIKHYSTAVILLVSSAEAYINDVISIKVKNESEKKEFDKLSVVGKWLLLPKLIKLKKGFSLGKEPLQSFNLLVKQRNKLIHFRAKPRQLGDFAIPDFIEELDFYPVMLEKYLYSVRDLIRQISLQHSGTYGPGWLSVGEEKYRHPCFSLGLLDNTVRMYMVSEKIDKNV